VPCTVGATEDGEIAEVSLETAYDDDGTASRHRRRRFEINLDVIENSFEAGELVTLEALKRMGLAPNRADHLKILARGALSKPLIIEAHEFTHAAEEMLRAVGGEAIRIRR
ncbi:MAG: uL15 family ribosomal protein, partial [Clostridia bacterium]|nr:uL15 family ribosomal protein [Clostridia bacterium]